MAVSEHVNRTHPLKIIFSIFQGGCDFDGWTVLLHLCWIGFADISFFVLQLHDSARISAETCSDKAKTQIFQCFPYTRLGPDLVILSPFWGIKFQNPCKKCPSHGEKNLKIFLFFKNVPKSPRKNFGHPKPIRNP